MARIVRSLSTLLAGVALFVGSGCDEPTEDDGPAPDPGQDLDGDGFTDDEDCDDQNGRISPRAVEVCDGVDNDCDGLVDDADDSVSPTSFLTFYEDGDRDGFGNPEVTAQACTVPAGFVDNDQDCDDTRDTTAPGASERCDGIDNDCDPETPDTGAVFAADSGGMQDLGEIFAGGTEATPASVVLDRDGTLDVCEGTWFVSLRIEADVVVQGQGDANLVILDGGGARPGIWVADPVDVVVKDLTVQNASDPVNTVPRGAALHCESDARVDGENLTLLGGPPSGFGGVLSAMDGCALSLVDSTLQDGLADLGGLAYIGAATATFERVGMLEGTAATRGGAVAVGTLHAEPDDSKPSGLTCTACSWTLNRANAETGGGGALYVGTGGTATMVGGGFDDNASGGVGGAVLLDSDGDANAVASFDTVAFANNLVNQAMDRDDVHVLALDESFAWDEGPVTVVCDEVDGCEL